ncbi:hypothetical protein [Methylobacterium haplocladii]|uniref:hypothetical protein n=1 Tax=Methylobacterium haplocladii TaxID=1176176 RepID=UPI001EE028B2|nr:hypothetical protein [Methylobacterium haplocladii]GJD82325.1 hypothetical protein HPGCJGGD_0177 [Methylobacterium haplocladii]GLS61431.1 hypothetical protein GCM10007887_41410 [Methylobacterium haplocladii]
MLTRTLIGAALALAVTAPCWAVEANKAPDESAATWQMPWQISPISSASQAAGEQTILSFVPGTGFVKGTPTALASIGQPLNNVPGPNRTINVCRTTVWSEASKQGAKEIEVVSAGPERRDRKGDYFAPVMMRLTYTRPFAYEVREAMLICVVNRAGGIVDAYAPE